MAAWRLRPTWYPLRVPSASVETVNVPRGTLLGKVGPLLSTRVRNYGDVFLAPHHATASWTSEWTSENRAKTLCRSWRVNFHSNRRASCSYRVWKRRKPVLDRLQILELVGGQHLALNNREIDLDLLQPALAWIGVKTGMSVGQAAWSRSTARAPRCAEPLSRTQNTRAAERYGSRLITSATNRSKAAIPRPGVIIKPGQALFEEALAPLADDLARRIEARSDDIIR